MALILELFKDHQLDFSIDHHALVSILDEMIKDEELEFRVNDDHNYEPYFYLEDFPKILEKLKFTLIPEIRNERILLSLFCPSAIKMHARLKKENQPYTRSSSSS